MQVGSSQAAAALRQAPSAAQGEAAALPLSAVTPLPAYLGQPSSSKQTPTPRQTTASQGPLSPTGSHERETLDVEQESQEAASERRARKGKARERLSEDSVGSPTALMPSDDELAGSNYPPATDEQVETRNVEEYLKSLAKTEKTRRASMRRSQTQPQGSGSAGSSPVKRSSSLLSRATSKRSTGSSLDSLRFTASSPTLPLQPIQGKMMRMADLTEADEELQPADDTTPKKSDLRINTDVPSSPVSNAQPSSNSAASPTRSDRTSISSNSTVCMTPTERAIKTGSRFAEDLTSQVSLPAGTSPNLKRTSAPPASLHRSPPSSASRSRFSLNMPSPNIFQPFSPSRNSLTIDRPVTDESDLGTAHAPMLTSQSYDGLRNSYFDSASLKAGSEHWDETPLSSPPKGKRPQMSYDNASMMTEEEHLMRPGRDSVRRDSVGDQQRSEYSEGRQIRAERRQQMGWMEWFCCMGCFEEAYDEDDEQSGRTGPDLL